MIRWTSGGAVPSPTVVQIRVQRRYPARIRAGAPVPTRSMSAEEVAANLDHFTVGLRGPRTRGCTGLVLSGAGVATRPELPDIVSASRAQGLERVVLHVEPGELDQLAVDAWREQAQLLVLPLVADHLAQAEAAVNRARAAGLALATHSVLSADSLPRLPEIADALRRLRPARHTFSFPFPTDPATVAAAPPPTDAAAALEALLPELLAEGLSLGIKGLPACYLQRTRPLLGLTGNRWYVDADHQRDQALLFFPDVVAFHRADACRFCAAAPRCDGFFAEWLRRPGSPALRPVEAEGAAAEGAAPDELLSD